METEEIEADIKSFICEFYGFDANNIDTCTALFEYPEIDSYAAIEILTHCEERWSIQIEAARLFDDSEFSIRKIAKFIFDAEKVNQ